MNAIETTALEKRYDVKDGEPVHALRGVAFQVHAGEIYALLGPNGAGKTTLISVLTTLLMPTAGTATVAGCDVATQADEVRRRIGVTFQEIVVDADLTGRQVLDFHARLYGLSRTVRQERIATLGALVELTDALDRKAGTYSGGMKRRLELARGLLSAPQVLFLDEPTQGLDPQNRSSIWRHIRRLRNEQGITVLLTTHYMEEAEALADRVGIIDHGQLVVEGQPGELVRQMGADVVTLAGNGDVAGLLGAVRALDFVTRVTEHAADGLVRVQIGVDDGERRLAGLIGAAAAAGFHVTQVNVNRPSLGDVFLAYTGADLRDE